MRVSASKLPLLRHCGFWAREDVYVPPPGPQSAAAALGTAMHAMADGGDFATLAAAPDVDADSLADLVDSYRAWWPGYSAGRAWRLEVPFALDVATGAARELPAAGQRNYDAATTTELPGTCDAVAPDEVLDLKGGRGAKTVAIYREQLAHAAVCLSRTTGARRVRITIAHVRSDGVETDSEVLDAFGLAEAATWMRRAAAAIPAAEPNPGPWCRDKFCPAIASCPATQAPLATVPEVRRLPLVGPIESDEDAWALLDALPRFEAWVKERKEAVWQRALRKPIVAADGRRYLIAKKSREEIDINASGALEALRGVLGPDADEALTFKASKESIERAARRHTGGKRGELGRVKAAALEAIRAAGAITNKTYDAEKYEPPALPAKGDAA